MLTHHDRPPRFFLTFLTSLQAILILNNKHFMMRREFVVPILDTVIVSYESVVGVKRVNLRLVVCECCVFVG